MAAINRLGWVPPAVALGLGLVLLFAGVMLMTSLEVELFRATTFERDFSGLTCGVPLDNPGWETGSPCHGAVNRQTGAGILLTGIGLLLTVGSIAIAMSNVLNPNLNQPGSSG